MTGGPRVTGTMPVGVLTVLTGAVLVAHLLALQYTPLTLGFNQPKGTRVFTTRSLQIDAAPALPEVQAVRANVAPPRPRAAATQPKIVSPRPAVGVAEAAAPLPPIAEAAPVDAQAAAPAEPEPGPVALANTPAASAPAPPVVPAPVEQAAPQTVQTAPAPLAKDAALVARAYTVPGSVRLKFNATGQSKKMNYFATGELLWLLREDNSYDARMELGAFLVGARVLSSAGRMTADGLAPTRFSDKFRSEQAAHFERDKGRVTFSSNAPDAPLLPGAQDQLSVFVQLASMIAGEPLQYPAGTHIAIQTVGTRSAEPWVFTVEADEKLQLPGGELDTLKLARNPRKEYDQKVEIWLAPKLAYLPVRIRITQTNGDFVDQQWRSTGTP